MNKVKFLILLACIFCFNFYFHGNQFSNNRQDGKDVRNIEPLLSDIFVGSYRVPGILVSVRLDRIVKIGLLSDMNTTWGDHSWKGLLLAAREINELGGILINGTQYYIGIVQEDTKEIVSRVISEAETATEYMIKNHQPHFITGGISDVPFYEYLKIIMDRKIPFISTTSAADDLCQEVLDDYERYKYFFRIMPGNWFSILVGVKDHILSLAKYLNVTYGGTGKNKIAILHDTSQFGKTAGFAFQNPLNPWFGLPNFNLTVVEDIEYSENAILEDFEMYWNQIEDAEAQITIILYMADPKIDLIVKQYQAVKPRCLLFSPMFGDGYSYFQFWDNNEGAHQFEIVLQNIENTSKTSLTIPFFNSFIKEYGVEPCFSGTGSYDAVYLLKHAVMESQSFNSDTIVTTLEKINSSNYFTGAGHNLAFTSSHDVLYGHPYGYGLLCQYKYIDGTKIVISSDEVYPDSIATDSLRLPYWGVNGFLTDPPDPPGDFTLKYDADNLDDDGKFNLSWTDSEGADNYSVYMSDNSMTYISKSFDLFAYQTATTPFSMALKQGEYYFRVVAYNETGETMSSQIHVSIPGPGPFILNANPDKPGSDGNFELFWTASERANNYSLYRYKSKITSINGSLTLLANQTTQRSYSVTGLSNGKYYFAVAAFNKLGYTLSDNEYIVIPFDMTVIIIVSISSVAGVASIVLVRRYLKHKGKKRAERERREPIIVEDMKREPLEKPKPEEKNKAEEKKK